jgi:hypothetical protein
MELCMSPSRNDFDAVSAIIDWLDACRHGDLKGLLSFYDDGAVLECTCEGVSLRGHELIAEYWAPKLKKKHPSAFSLDHLTLTDHGVQIDYQDFTGKPVRLYFRFGACNKIIYTTSGPRASGLRKMDVH